MRKVRIVAIPKMQQGGNLLDKVAPQSKEEYVQNKYHSLLQRYQPWTKEDEQGLDDRAEIIRHLEGIHTPNANSYPINPRTLSPQYPRDYNIASKPQFETIESPQIIENGYRYGGRAKMMQMGGSSPHYTYERLPQPPQGLYGQYTQEQLNNEMGKTWRDVHGFQTGVDTPAIVSNGFTLSETGSPVPRQMNTAIQQPQISSNLYTDEPTDYSVDSTRSAKFGGMKKRVRITGTPMTGIGTHGPAATPDATMMSLGGTNYVPGGPGGYGNQQSGRGYALDRFWSSPAGYPGATSKLNPYAKIGTTLPEAKDGGDINAEKQERVLGDFDQDGSLELMNVNGPSHAEGGKNVDVPSHSFVFSDTKDLKIKDPSVLALFSLQPKRGGYTPADIAAKYDLNKYKKITDNPDSDDYAMKTAQLMSDSYLAKLNKLAEVQETMKKHMGMEHSADGISRYGGVPKMQYAGPYDQNKYVHNNNLGIDQENPNYAPIYAESPIGAAAPDFSKSMMFNSGLPNPNYGTGVPGQDIWTMGRDAQGNPIDPTAKDATGLSDFDRAKMYTAASMTNPAFLNPRDPSISHSDDYNNKTGMFGSSSSSSSPKKKAGMPNIEMDPNFYGNMQNVLQMANLRKFQPYEPVPQAVIPDTVFLDPTRAIAAQQEAARSGSEMDAMSGNPQAARAMALARQGVAGAQAADTVGKYHNEDVGIANTANKDAAAITTDLFQRQASRLAELNKANFLSDRDYQREMGRLQAENVNRYQKQHDNSVKTAWLNKTSPYFNIDPVTQMPDFKDKDAQAKFFNTIQGMSPSSTGNEYQDFANDLKNIKASMPGASDAEIAMAVRHLESKRSKASYDASGRLKAFTESGYEDQEGDRPPYQRKMGGPLMSMGGTVDLYDNTKLRKFMK